MMSATGTRTGWSSWVAATTCSSSTAKISFERLVREGRVLDTAWDNYTMANVNITHPNLSADQMERGIIEFYRRMNTPERYVEKLSYFKGVFREHRRRERA